MGFAEVATNWPRTWVISPGKSPLPLGLRFWAAGRGGSNRGGSGGGVAGQGGSGWAGGERACKQAFLGHCDQGSSSSPMWGCLWQAHEIVSSIHGTKEKLTNFHSTPTTLLQFHPSWRRAPIRIKNRRKRGNGIEQVFQTVHPFLESEGSGDLVEVSLRNRGLRRNGGVGHGLSHEAGVEQATFPNGATVFGKVRVWRG